MAARRIHVQLGAHQLHSNLMIALCSHTSLYAKTTTARVATILLRAAGLHFLLGSERTTPQKLLSDMAGIHVPASYEEKTRAEQDFLRDRLAVAGQRGWYNDEFGKLIRQMAKGTNAMSDFADLFLQVESYPESYENATLTRSQEPINKPYLALLGP